MAALTDWLSFLRRRSRLAEILRDRKWGELEDLLLGLRRRVNENTSLPASDPDSRLLRWLAEQEPEFARDAVELLARLRPDWARDTLIFVHERNQDTRVGADALNALSVRDDPLVMDYLKSRLSRPAELRDLAPETLQTLALREAFRKAVLERLEGPPAAGGAPGAAAPPSSLPALVDLARHFPPESTAPVFVRLALDPARGWDLRRACLQGLALQDPAQAVATIRALLAGSASAATAQALAPFAVNCPAEALAAARALILDGGTDERAAAFLLLELPIAAGAPAVVEGLLQWLAAPEAALVSGSIEAALRFLPGRFEPSLDEQYLVKWIGLARGGALPPEDLRRLALLIEARLGPAAGRKLAPVIPALEALVDELWHLSPRSGRGWTLALGAVTIEVAPEDESMIRPATETLLIRLPEKPLHEFEVLAARAEAFRPPGTLLRESLNGAVTPDAAAEVARAFAQDPAVVEWVLDRGAELLAWLCRESTPGERKRILDALAISAPAWAVRVGRAMTTMEPPHVKEAETPAEED